MRIIWTLSNILGIATLTTAACKGDHDFRVALISSQVYYAPVGNDGTITELGDAQCLFPFDNSCIPCDTIKAQKVSIPEDMASCKVYIPDKKQRGTAEGDEDVGIEVGQLATRAVDGRFEMVVDPPKVIRAIQCGV